MAIIPANVNQLDLKAVFELNKFYLTLIITVYIYIYDVCSTHKCTQATPNDWRLIDIHSTVRITQPSIGSISVLDLIDKFFNYRRK